MTRRAKRPTDDQAIMELASSPGAKSLTVAVPAEMAPPAPESKPKRNRMELPEDCLLLAGRYVVTIPEWHPASLNALTKRGNHFAAARQKKRDAITLGLALRAAGVPAANGKRRVGLVIILGPKQRGCDGDAYWKSLLDGLQRCKALTGDNRQRCEFTAPEFERGTVKATRLILKDVA